MVMEGLLLPVPTWDPSSRKEEGGKMKGSVSMFSPFIFPGVILAESHSHVISQTSRMSLLAEREDGKQ